MPKSKKEWKEKTKQKERQKSFTTTSDIEIERLYTTEDIEGLDYESDLGYPGEYPFTRGIYPTMYRGRLWTMRQYAGFGAAEETNERFKYLFSQGQTGLSVAFDLPTQMGYDSDHPMSQGEVGKVGVAIDSLQDMETLFNGIPLGEVSTSMTINATASMLLAMYIVAAEKQGVPPDRIDGTVQNDILKEYAARGTYIFPPKDSVRITIDVMEYCRDSVPKWNPISVSGYHMREAGATAVQELAFMLADGIEYLEAAGARGLDVEKIAERVSFFYAVHNNFLEEIAKFRAGRRLWAKIMKERFGAKDPRACMLRFHSQTSGVALMAQQPRNNIIRVALQALAAVLGGTQSLHTNSYDEALALPSEEAATIALRTQQIIAYESGVTETIDPLAGSYFVEAMTNRLEEKAKEYIEKIDKIGGMTKAIEQGYIQREIEESAYKYQREVEKKERIIVGVNEYTVAEEDVGEVHKVDPMVREIQIEKLARLKKRRNNEKVKWALKELEYAAKTGKNLMPYIIEAVRNYATIGEMTGVLENIFGRYRPGRAIFG